MGSEMCIRDRQEATDASSEVVLVAVSQLIQSNESMQSQLQNAKDRVQQQTMQIESAERRQKRTHSHKFRIDVLLIPI